MEAKSSTIVLRMYVHVLETKVTGSEHVRIHKYLSLPTYPAIRKELASSHYVIEHKLQQHTPRNWNNWDYKIQHISTLLHTHTQRERRRPMSGLPIPVQLAEWVGGGCCNEGIRAEAFNHTSSSLTQGTFLEVVAMLRADAIKCQ